MVGAGPGGAAAALALARAGAAVTLYRPARAGEKPCGGAIPDAFLPAIDGFDCERARAAFGRAPAARARERRRIARRGREPGAARLPSRRLRRGARERGASRPARGWSRTGWKRSGSSPARRRGAAPATCGAVIAYLVAADGARGLARRSLGLRARRRERRSRRVARRARCPIVSRSASPTPPTPTAGSSRVPAAPRSASPTTPARLSHGAAQAALGRFLDRHLAGGRGALDRARRYRYPIPIWSAATRAAARRALRSRVLLVGDAAGVADPLTREGIRYALLSGRWAAECLLAGAAEAYRRSPRRRARARARSSAPRGAPLLRRAAGAVDGAGGAPALRHPRRCWAICSPAGRPIAGCAERCCGPPSGGMLCHGDDDPRQ